MRSDDVYRSDLEATTAAIRYWVPSIADVADVAESDGPEGWRIAVTPRVEGACPFELMLSPAQTCSLVVCGEAYDDLPMPSLDLILPLVEAIVAGRVTRRIERSAATGAVVRVETVARLAGGREWREGREEARLARLTPPEERVATRRGYLPYHR